MRILIVLIIIIVTAYAGVITYFYFDLFTRNRQLTLAMEDVQSLKRKQQEELSRKDAIQEVLQKENEQLKKESLDYLKREKEINEKRKQLEELLKQQNQQLKYRQEQLQEAQATLEDLKENNRKLSDVSDFSGSVQIKKQEQKIIKLKEELADFQERISKQEALLHYNLGVSYTKDKKYEVAISEYEKALNLNPQDPDTHYNLAIIYDDYRRNPALAIEHYSRYLELKKDAHDQDEVKEWIARLEK